MTQVQQEIIDFIKRRGGAVTDMDLAEYFDVLADPNRVFPLFQAINHSLEQGSLKRISANHPVQGGRLAVRLATDAIA